MNPHADLSKNSAGNRPIDILTTLQKRTTPSVQSNTMRPIDILASVKARASHVSSSTSASQTPNDPTLRVVGQPSIPTNMRPIDIWASLRPSLGKATTVLTDQPLTTGISPPVSGPSSLRRICPLPKRCTSKPIPLRLDQQAGTSRAHEAHALLLQNANSSQPTASKAETQDVSMGPPIDNSTFIDLTLDSPILPLFSEILELTDSSDESEGCAMDMDSKPDVDQTDPIANDDKGMAAGHIFDTKNILASRNTVEPWVGSLRPEDWIPSREELHAHQVDLDRCLPSDLVKSGHPKFAISPAEIESMHHFLMARYQVSDFDEYKQVLALFRNTRAISSQKARARHAELLTLQNQVEAARQHLFGLLRQGQQNQGI